MGLESLEGVRVPATGDEGLDERPALQQAAPITDALSRILDDLGFQTASVFVKDAGAWRLLERVGAFQPWHEILDPTLIEGTGEVAEYPDARAVPGIGPRLRALGCAAIAVLPLPHEARLILDGGRAPLRGGWIERARPYLALLDLMWGPSWPAEAGLRTTAELASLNRLFAACQHVLARPGAVLEDLLSGAREALGADELCVVSERAAGADVTFAPPLRARRLAEPVRTYLGGPDGTAIEVDALARLSVAVGMSSRAVAAAAGREGPFPELLVAGWVEGPALSEASMAIAARTVSTVRAAIEARGHAVNAIVDKERARMAYALHDDLTQTVTGAVLELEALRGRIERDPGEAVAALERSKAEIRRALAELRAMLFDLAATGETGQPATPPLARYVEDVVKRWRLPARVAVEGDLSTIPGRVRSVAYVVIREALANAAKHAGGRNVSVQLSAVGSELAVVVGDSGPGFSREDEKSARNGHHLGLEMLRRRVAEVGGHIDIESRPGGGTRVVARLPIEGAVQ